MLNYRDQVHPYMPYWYAHLRLAAGRQRGHKVPILLVRTGTREVAIQVSGRRGTRRKLDQGAGSQLAELKGLSGATILGDGRVVLILDVISLWYRDDTIHFERRRRQVRGGRGTGTPLVMVGTKSTLTVQKIEEGLKAADDWPRVVAGGGQAPARPEMILSGPNPP